jgi:hypothetical protein
MEYAEIGKARRQLIVFWQEYNIEKRKKLTSLTMDQENGGGKLWVMFIAMWLLYDFDGWRLHYLMMPH